MLADQVQLILRQRQSLHNVFDEVVRRDGSQVPLQFAKNHQFPFLKGDKYARKRNIYGKEYKRKGLFWISRLSQSWNICH